MARWFIAGFSAALAAISIPAFAAPTITNFSAAVEGQQVSYSFEACDIAASSAEVLLYYDSADPPAIGAPADQRKNATFSDSCPVVNFERSQTPVGLYRSWARAGDALNGPLEVCVGPDLALSDFAVTNVGAAISFKVTVCNQGSAPARNMRIAFWQHLASTPTDDDMGELFEPLVELAPAACKEIERDGGLHPNGQFNAWASADRGDLAVNECRERNNTTGPLPYTLRNPDLVLESFSASVDGSTVTYSSRVCNRGAAAVAVAFADVYFDRPREPPLIKEPGDVTQPIRDLAPAQCRVLTFVQRNVAAGSYTSYCVLDSDQLLNEPNEGDNQSQALAVRVGDGSGSGPGSDACVDADADGHGVGPGCSGVPDCNDANPAIHFGASEICDDGVDQDCDLTPDDGCPGIDCVDRDGDGFGVGSGCVLADYDDSNRELYPWAPPERQGEGRGCIDRDADGWGVGPGCAGVPDCDDADPQRHPGLKQERCGNRVDDDCDLTIDEGCPGSDCVDRDGDGWGTGPGCAIGDPDDDNPSIYPYARCVDRDGDGYGMGPDCLGAPDCDDSDPERNPAAQEVCGDGIDNDCDLTIDDGCDGVDCRDADGDGYGVGADCVLADCDDNAPTIHPWALETCGDNDDDNCNGIADDGCWGRRCVDRDGDGFGVGESCPGPQDCDDTAFGIKPGASELCGDGVDQDCDGVADDGCPDAVDTDGDGAFVGGRPNGQPDCDDQDPKIGPGAAEVCGDGVDNNCNLTVDDGCPGIACTDADGDGWGVGPGCTVADCDDQNPAIHPWAQEICGDRVDNDCDGTTDDGCPGVEGVECSDADLDGWGVGPGCARQDCNDKDGGISPWVLEICNDDIDNNCDGSIDEGCLVCRDRDSDGHGVGPRCSNWDCIDEDPNVFPGAPEICDGKDSNCDGVISADELRCNASDSGCGCITTRAPADELGRAAGLLLLVLLARGLRSRSRRRCAARGPQAAR